MNASISSCNEKKEAKKYFYLYLFFITIQASQTLIPYSHGDALYYHLVGPKLWENSNWNSMWEDLSHYAQAGYFDLLYFIPFVFSKSLLLNQIIGQIIHFIFSILLASIFIYKNIPNKVLASIGAIALLTIAKDSSFFVYAKNDGALAFFSLIGTYYVINVKNNNLNILLIGFLLGLIPGVKMSGLMVVLPLVSILSLYVIRKKLKISSFIKIGLIAILIFIPHLVKNGYYTGNIFFPAFVSHFPGNLTDPMLYHYSLNYGNHVTITILLAQLNDLFLGKVVFLITPIVIYANYKKNNQNILYLYTAISIFLLYIVFNGSLVQPRYFFASYFILTYYIFLSAHNVFELFSSIKHTKLITIFIFLIVISDSKLDLSINNIVNLSKNITIYSEKELINHYIPFTNLWNKIETTDQHEYVISDLLSMSYYLPKNVRLHTARQSIGADFLLSCNKVDDLQKLEKYKYVLLRENRNNKCYNLIKEHYEILENVDEHILYKRTNISI